VFPPPSPRKGAAATLFLAILLAAASVGAADGEDWQPESPVPAMPEKFDWVQLTSDEWLKGEFIVMYDDELQFDSEEMDEQKFDLDDVREVRTARLMQVGLITGEIVVGKLYIDGEDVRVLLGGNERRVSRWEVLSITAGAPKEINYWSAKVSLGGNVRRGNSNVIEASVAAKVLRRTIKNRLTIDYALGYNVTEEIETANNQRLTIVWDRFVTRRVYATPVSFEWFRDPFQNVSNRETLGFGAGYELVNTAKTDWTVTGGPAYQQTTFVSVEPGTPETERTAAFAAGTDLDMEVTGWVDFLWEYDFQIVNEVSGRYIHHFVLGFETEITRLLDFDVRGVWDYIDKPREAEDGTVPDQNDVRLVVGLTFDW
jgi:hypothetical protein